MVFANEDAFGHRILFNTAKGKNTAIST